MNFESPNKRGSVHDAMIHKPLSEVNIKKINKEREAQRIEKKANEAFKRSNELLKNNQEKSKNESPIYSKSLEENFQKRMEQLRQEIQNEDLYLN